MTAPARQCKHIGIVGCSAPGAALCYTTICTESAEFMGPHCHPEISIHTSSFDAYLKAWREGRWDTVGKLMAASAEKLLAMGAEILICPDNTVHEAFDQATARSSGYWIHIAEVVAQEAKRRGHSRIGVLGTRQLMEGPVYRERLSSASIDSVIPDEATRAEIDRAIVEELVYGRLEERTLQFFRGAIKGLAKQGCDAVVLGCTEIPLLLSPTDSPLPTLDSTRLLARAALRKAISVRGSRSEEGD